MRMLLFALPAIAGAIVLCAPGHGRALDAPPLRVMDVLEPTYFFRASPSWRIAECDGGEAARIQGEEVSLPVPRGMDVEWAAAQAGRDHVSIRLDGVLLVECVFQRRHILEQDSRGEPFNTMKRVGQNELLKNIIIHGAALDNGDGGGIAENLPVISLVQNTADSFVLEARANTGDDTDEATGMDAIFEGVILLGRVAVPFSAIGYDNTVEMDSGAVFLDWLNCFLDRNRR